MEKRRGVNYAILSHSWGPTLIRVSGQFLSAQKEFRKLRVSLTLAYDGPGSTLQADERNQQGDGCFLDPATLSGGNAWSTGAQRPGVHGIFSAFIRLDGGRWGALRAPRRRARAMALWG